MGRYMAAVLATRDTVHKKKQNTFHCSGQG